MKILVAEQDPVLLGQIQDSLGQEGYEVVVCSDGADAWRVLQEETRPSLSILDWNLPSMDGPSICQHFRELYNQFYVYMILMSPEQPKRSLLKGLEMGADEYMVKPIDMYELQLRVRAGVRIINLQETLISVLKLSEHEAAHDPLTGLWNRQAIGDLLRKELGRTKRELASVGVIATTLDQFAGLSEKYGELTRDSIVREVVLRIQSAVRSYDLVGRIGDEAFLIIAPGCDGERSKSLAQRLSAAVSRFKAAIGDHAVPLSMSCGVVYATGKEGLRADSLINEAEQALRVAVAKGGGQVEVRESLA